MENQTAPNTKRLKIYIGESDLWNGKALYMVLLETLQKAGLAGATVTHGIAGFGAHSRIHTASIIRLSEDLPLLIEVIDYTDKIEAVLETIHPMVREGLITLEDVQVLKYTHRALNPLPGDRPVRDVMSSHIESIHPESSVADAWKMMVQFQRKALPVVNDQDKVVGIVTDGDLIERAGLQQRLSVAKNLDTPIIEREIQELAADKKNVADVMSRPVVIISEHDTLSHAVTLLKKYHLKRIPVTSNGGKLVGMLSRFDILRQVVPLEYAEPSNITLLNIPKQVGEVMKPEIPLVKESDPLETIIEAFLINNTHRLIVVNEENRVTGILSDGDVVNRLPDPNKQPILSALTNREKPPSQKVTAVQMMSKDPIKAKPELPIPQAIQLMMEQGRKWLVVVDAERHPLGLVDRQQLLEALINIPNIPG